VSPRSPLPQWIALVLLALICGAGMATCAYAAVPPVPIPHLRSGMPLVPQTELLEDRTGQLELTQARAAPGWRREDQSALVFGFSRSAFWARWHLHNTSPSEQDLVFDLGNARQDHISWYVFRGDDPLPAQIIHSGDRQPFAQRPLPARSFALPLRMAAGEKVQLLVRLASHDGLYEAMPVRLLPREVFLAEEEEMSLVVTLYHGGLLALALYNLLLYIATRERAFALYVGYLLSLLLWNFTFQGYGFKHLWPESMAFNNNVLTVGAAWAFGIFGFFTVEYLKLHDSVPRWVLRTNQALAWANMAVVVPAVADFYALGAGIGQATGIAMALTSLSTGIWLLRRGQRQARFFVLAFSVLGVGASAYILQVVGAVPANGFTTWGLQVGSGFEALVLALGLADTMNTLKAQTLEAERRARQAQEAANQQLEAQVADRTKALEHANQRLHLLAVTDALTGAFNRRHFNDICARALGQRPRSEPLAFCMFDLDHFKLYNDTYGHQAGDAALKAVAAAVQAECERASDALFRLGGEEFGVLFTAASESQAVAFVEQLRQAILAQRIAHEGNPQGCMTASFGVGWWDETGDSSLTPQAMYADVDNALYAAKAAGRNVVRLCQRAQPDLIPG
jgi:two-component system, sensor histidine kinase LadS